MNRVRGAAIAVLAVACTKPTATTSEADASVATSAPDASAAPPVSGREVATRSCLPCHGEEMLAQQRLPREKWAAEVKKMVGWGAAVEPSETEALVDHLAASYGPDAGPWEPKLVSAESAAQALAPEDADAGAFASGDAAQGARLFAERCASCHGPEARGLPALGIALADRPVLGRASVVASTVRGGRGKMPPMPATTDREIADILAHLRTLRAP